MMRTRAEILTDLAIMERAWEEHLPLVKAMEKDPDADYITQKFMVLALMYLTHRQRQKSENASLRDFTLGVGIAYKMAESYKNLMDAHPNRDERNAFYEETIQRITKQGLIKPS